MSTKELLRTIGPPNYEVESKLRAFGFFRGSFLQGQHGLHDYFLRLRSSKRVIPNLVSNYRLYVSTTIISVAKGYGFRRLTYLVNVSNVARFLNVSNDVSFGYKGAIVAYTRFVRIYGAVFGFRINIARKEGVRRFLAT